MQRVTRAEAARAIGVNKSTMTRWVQQHPALIGEDGLVDLDELREHRDMVVNPKLQTRESRESVATAGRAAPALPGLNDHRARGELAKAVTAELDLAQRLNLTLVREDVERQLAAAGEVLKRLAGEVAKDRAEALVRIEDPREMERALDELLRQMLERGANALLAAGTTPADPEGVGDEQPESDAA